MSAPLVRPATAADLGAVTAIYRHHVLHGLASFELEPPDAHEIARRYAEIRELGLPYFVAELQGKVAGYAYACVYLARPPYSYTVQNSVYVGHEYTTQVIG